MWRKHSLTGNYANVDVTCRSVAGLSHQMPALTTLALVSTCLRPLLILLHPVSPLTTTTISSLSLHPPPTPPSPRLRPLAPVLRCGVAIATQKCGNTSVLHSRERRAKGERKEEWGGKGWDELGVRRRKTRGRERKCGKDC